MTDWIKVEGVSSEGSELWNYLEDKELVGIYKSKKENVGPNKSNMYFVEDKKGNLKSFWGTTLLDDRFSTIATGEEVKLVYLGKSTSEKSGRSYHNFDIYHREAF